MDISNINNMEKISLYEITEGINKIEELVDDEQELTKYLDSLNLQFGEKVSNILKYRRSLELTQDAISSEIDRLTSLKKIYARKGENLKNYVSYSMQKTNNKNLELDIAKLSFRKSASVEIFNEELVSDEYKKVKTVSTIDKVLIKATLKAGQAVSGATLKENLNLQIK